MFHQNIIRCIVLRSFALSEWKKMLNYINHIWPCSQCSWCYLLSFNQSSSTKTQREIRRRIDSNINISSSLKNFKKNFMAPFYGWGSTASRLVPLWGGSLLFTLKFPDIPGTHFINLGRMKCWVDLGAIQWFWTRDPWIGNPAP